MTRPVVIIPVAEEELLHAASFYEERAPGLGGEFLSVARVPKLPGGHLPDGA